MIIPLQKTFLTLNSYNFNAYNNSNCDINVQIKDYNGTPISNQSVDIYLDDILIDTIITNSNGSGIVTYTFSSRDDIGIHSIRANDCSVVLRVYFDSSWQPATYVSNYQNHSSGDVPLEYRIYNDIVEIRGATTNKATRNTTGEKIAAIPSQYAPNTIVRTILQGSTANKFIISVNTSGEIVWARYGTTTTVSSLPEHQWLGTYIMYTI